MDKLLQQGTEVMNMALHLLPGLQLTLASSLTSSSFLQVGEQKSYFLLQLQPLVPALWLPDGSEQRLFCLSLLPVCRGCMAADGGEASPHPSFSALFHLQQDPAALSHLLQALPG